MEGYCVRAGNTAPDSENRIHDDQTAAAYGFRRGLVPGFTVYGYLTVPVVHRFGVDWLEREGTRVRFLESIYEGDAVIAVLIENLASACRRDGTVCATESSFGPRASHRHSHGARRNRCQRSPASIVCLPRHWPHSALFVPTCRRRTTRSWPCRDEILPVYQEGILHPAALPSLSNQVLIQNVKLGPGFTLPANSVISIWRGTEISLPRAAKWKNALNAKAISSLFWTYLW